MSILLVTVFVGNQPIRIQHFLKMNCLLFLQNLNHYLKNVYQKTFELPRVLQEKEKNSNFFIDDDSYFFHNFLDALIAQNRVIRLSKGLFRKTYSIKEFTFDSHIAYQIAFLS